MELLKYHLKPSENKIIATVIIFCVYLVYSTFVLSIAQNAFGPFLLFFLYLFGGPGAFVYMGTKEDSQIFVALILITLAIYQYLLTCFFEYLRDRFSKKETLIKPRSFKF